MNTISENRYQAQAHRAIGKMLSLVVWVSAVCYGLYALVVAPLFTQLDTNVVYQNSVITLILSFVPEILDVTVFAIVYPATIYAIWRGGFRKAYRIPLVFALLTLAKYIVNFFMTCLTDGGFPSWEIFVETDMPNMLPAFLLEILQYGLVLALAVVIRATRLRCSEEEKLYSRKTIQVRSLAFPITKLISRASAVQWTSLWVSVVILIGRWFNHGMYQLTLLVYNGQPDSAAVIVIDFVSDVFVAAVMYFVSILLLSYFDKKEMEALSAEE